MEGTRCGTEEKERIIQHAAVFPRFRSRFQLFCKATKFFAEKATVDTEILPAAWILRLVG